MSEFNSRGQGRKAGHSPWFSSPKEERDSRAESGFAFRRDLERAADGGEEAEGEYLYELPFDQFQRYQSVRDIVSLLGKNRPLEVLDVGGYPGLISDFLPRENTYVLDVVECELPNYIRGDGTALPFKDGSFDVVTSLDVYEHISEERREAFIEELCRVSRDLVILSAPFKDRDVELAEQLLYDFVVRVFGEFPTLKEHLDQGLPYLSSLITQLKAKGLPTVYFPSGQLYNWLIMMLIKHYITAVLNSEKIQREVDKLYNLNFSPGDHESPSYRKVVVVSQAGGDSFLEEVVEEFKPLEPNSDEIARKIQLFQMLVDLLNLQVNQQVAAQEAHISRLEKELRAKEKEIASLAKELQEKQQEIHRVTERSRLDMQHIENLERFVEKVKRSFPYRIYSFWRRTKS